MNKRLIALSLAVLVSLGAAACEGDAATPVDGTNPTEDEAGLQQEGTGTDALDTDEGVVEEPTDDAS